MPDEKQSTITVDSLVEELKTAPPSVPTTPTPVAPKPLAPVPPVVPAPRPTLPPTVPPAPLPKPAPLPSSPITPAPLPSAPTPLPDTPPVSMKTMNLPSQTAPAAPLAGQSQASSPKGYKTAVRSMTDDIASLKTGQQPKAQEVRLAPLSPSTPAPVRPIVPAPTPVIPKPLTPPLFPSGPTPTAPSRPSLGVTPLPGTGSAGPLPAPRTPLPTAPISIPETTGGGFNKLFLIVPVVLLLVGGLVWFFLFRSGEPQITESPTPTPSPTATPAQSLTSLFGGTTETIELLDSGNVIGDFYTKLNNITVDAGQFKRLSLTSPSKGTGEYSPVELLEKYAPELAPSIKAAAGEEYIILVYGQLESWDSQGQRIADAVVQKRLVAIVEAKDPSAMRQATNNLEPAVESNLAAVANVDPSKAAGQQFIENIFQGTPIRYKNYPYPDQSIDYAIFNSSSGKNYLIITNSRESIFSTLDKLGQ